jgi:two-component system, chemotaxis family, chemotaxis protein CheY
MLDMEVRMQKILVVDDAAFIRKRYVKELQSGGYDVEEAVNGAEALEKYKKDRPDGVLLDINMPVMDGLLTLHEIMNYDHSARVAMVTCVGAQSVVLTALRTGARDFVTKPTDYAGLMSSVNKLLT